MHGDNGPCANTGSVVIIAGIYLIIKTGLGLFISGISSEVAAGKQ
jgi:hypothetical protein